MFVYASPGEGLAWLEASVEDLAEFDALTFAAAAERREDTATAGDGTP